MLQSRWMRRLVAGGAILAASVTGYYTYPHWQPYVFPHVEPEEAADRPAEAAHSPPDQIKLSPQAQKNLDLRSATLTPQEYWRTMVIPGVVIDRPGQTDISVHARTSGVIADIAIRHGQAVRPGDVLFRIELVSESLQSAQIELARTASELNLARTERDRISRMVESGSAATAELTRAQNQLDRLLNLQRSLKRQLVLYGLTDDQIQRIEQGELVTEIMVRAPLPPNRSSQEFAFEVQELKVHPGEHVTSGTRLCTLADHSQLFIEGWAFKSEAKVLTDAAIRQQPITAEFVDETHDEWPSLEPLTIHHLANQLDSESRTFPFYLNLTNQYRTFTRDGRTYFAWRFRPGQRVRLRIPIERLVTYGPDGKTERLPFVVPAAAVVREGPEAYVFIQAGDVFLRRPVHVLHEDRRVTVIANDGSITLADLVVLNQATALNRALKMAAGDHHHHDHDH